VRLEEAHSQPSFLAEILSEGRVLVDATQPGTNSAATRQSSGRRRLREIAMTSRERSRGSPAFASELHWRRRAHAKRTRPGLRRADTPGSRAEAAFEALRAAKVINASLRRRLVRAQAARSRVEHSYLGAPAGDVHRATQLVHAAARDFIAAYRPWIEPLLKPGER